MKRNLTQFPESTPVSDLCKYDEVKDWEKIPRSVGLYSTGKRIPHKTQNHRTLSDWNLIARVVYIICMACRCLVISCMQKNGIHGNHSAAADLSMNGSFAAKSAFQNTSKYGHFSFISRRILSNALESIFSIDQNTSAIFGNQRKFRVNGFWVKLWSYWESFRIIYI